MAAITIDTKLWILDTATLKLREEVVLDDLRTMLEEQYWPQSSLIVFDNKEEAHAELKHRQNIRSILADCIGLTPEALVAVHQLIQNSEKRQCNY